MPILSFDLLTRHELPNRFQIRPHFVEFTINGLDPKKIYDLEISVLDDFTIIGWVANLTLGYGYREIGDTGPFVNIYL